MKTATGRYCMSFGTLKKNLKRDVRATCILIKIEFFLWQLRNFDPRNRLNTVWFYLINVCFSSILKNWEHLLRFLFLLLWSTKKTIRTIDGRVIGLLLAFQIFKLTPMMPNKFSLNKLQYLKLRLDYWQFDTTQNQCQKNTCNLDSTFCISIQLNVLSFTSKSCHFRSIKSLHTMITKNQKSVPLHQAISHKLYFSA